MDFGYFKHVYVILINFYYMYLKFHAHDRKVQHENVFEPHFEKNGFLPMRKQRCRSAVQ